MNLAVLGLWHLGSVTAACMAAAGHQVAGWDPDPDILGRLRQNVPPVAEPGLAELISEQSAAGRLTFPGALADAVSQADVVWITFDTPVDADDRADVDYVIQQVVASFPHDGAVTQGGSGGEWGWTNAPDTSGTSQSCRRRRTRCRRLAARAGSSPRRSAATCSGP